MKSSLRLLTACILLCLLLCTAACSGVTTDPSTSASATATATETTTEQSTEQATEAPTGEHTPTPSVNTTASVKPSDTVSPTVKPTVAPSETWGGNSMTFNGKKTTISVNSDTVSATTKYPTFSFLNQSTITLGTTATSQFNYYSITYKSSQPLWFYVLYTRNGVAYEELSFLDASEEFTTFNSYVDGFMDGNVTAINITGFRFDNRNRSSKKKTATLEISSISTQNKPSVERTVYLQNNYVILGADLLYGGAISYLEYIKEPVAMVTKNGRAEIGLNYANLGNVRNTRVNLLNNYDTGRLVQQSYYGTYGGGDGYTPGQFSGMTWCYNPVMGGDRGNTHSKIVDFVATSTSIYVKCRPMDWGHVNNPTYSYMESTYTLEGRNVLVNNRFTDYSPYTHVRANQELPALYVSEPLYRLIYCPEGEPWQHGNFAVETKPGDWNGVWPMFKSTENWWAWVNGDDQNPFGIGLYVPGVTEVTGGIHKCGGNVGNDASKAAPTSYIAPLRQMTIRVFKPIEYSYALICGTLAEIRGSVYDLNSRKVLDNSSLLTYR